MSVITLADLIHFGPGPDPTFFGGRLWIRIRLNKINLQICSTDFWPYFWMQSRSTLSRGGYVFPRNVFFFSLENCWKWIFVNERPIKYRGRFRLPDPIAKVADPAKRLGSDRIKNFFLALFPSFSSKWLPIIFFPFYYCWLFAVMRIRARFFWFGFDLTAKRRIRIWQWSY